MGVALDQRQVLLIEGLVGSATASYVGKRNERPHQVINKITGNLGEDCQNKEIDDERDNCCVSKKLQRIRSKMVNRKAAEKATRPEINAQRAIDASTV